MAPDARDDLNNIANQFRIDVKEVAERIAINDGHGIVSTRHVEESLIVLRRSGLQRDSRRLFQKPETRIAIGALLIGFAPTISSIVKDIVQPWPGELHDHPGWFWIGMIAIPFLVFGGGIALTVWGCVASRRHR